MPLMTIFGLLDDNEGSGVGEIVDVGIGRFPVRTRAEAQAMVDKLRAYISSASQGAWRTWVAFIGDDEDEVDNSLIHMSQADALARKVRGNHPEYNIDKIMLDAYQQVTGSGGARYPEVNEAIDRRIDAGSLLLSYTGHGGELGWAHERVLEVHQINDWTNINRLPLFLTATCEFSRYDDPLRTSAGEWVLLNPSGGAIGLMTTTRLVTAGQNFDLANAFFDHVFNEVDGEMPRLGDIVRLTKLTEPNKQVNSRKFNLLGDPALRLAYPKYKVVTTSVPDTMQALGKVKVTGYVADINGTKLKDFNGVLYSTAFDKAYEVETQDNEGWGPFYFDIQNNAIFKGKASVKNGDFSFEFVVPKDINYQVGPGRNSYYVTNGDIDGIGYHDQHDVGSVSATAIDDTDGPDLDLYLNDENFVYGGITDENPDLLAKVFDVNGINTSSSGVGHDIVAYLDENTADALILNDYYESDLDSYQSGKVVYPFKDLKEGNHKLRLKVWDVNNNSTETVTEFVVSSGADLALDHILNYPNPFTTNTGFYFDHNQPGQSLQVRLQVFTVSGKVVKTIDGFYNSDGYRIGPIPWDGRDDFGDLIGKGVYIYKLKVTAPSGQSAEEFQKLVLLK